MERIAESELILNPDGSVYHLNLLPHEIADDIIVVGDPNRVPEISRYFDRIEVKKSKRELHTHTGILNGHRLSVLSTGMGTDNIDIVMNELDALANINLQERCPANVHRSLNIIRLGTSGGLQSTIPVDTFLLSQYAIGLDGLMNFYKMDTALREPAMEAAFMAHMQWPDNLAHPYAVAASPELIHRLGQGITAGITATAPGFYGPQGRVLRIPLAYPQFNQNIENFQYNGYRVSNFEMETSAIYGLGRQLGHQTLTICAVIANRVSKAYSKDYQPVVRRLIQLVLERLTA